MSTSPNHAERAARFVADTERTRWHDDALWFVRSKRDKAADDVPDWEALRAEAASIKRNTLARLPELWTRFESAAEASGAIVHWAADAAEHNALVLDLLKRHAATQVVKSKSMLTEECGLNAHLEANGINVVDTDLGERIVQLRGETPSHIVMPAIHLRRREIGELFHTEMGSPLDCDDPTELTHVARANLRPRFLEADAGITGVNFAIAETGGLVVCTNEGNADLGTVIPKLHIACVGLEKIIPSLEDLPTFLRLLARSATGQAITSYTSHFHGPQSEEHALHIVVVDNGRSQLLAHDGLHEALACIRCGACMNTCPVYRRSGGHSYGTTIPGPIGSVLEPARRPDAHAGLPHACSLCGSCADVCPVKIPLHQQLLTLRAEAFAAGLAPGGRRLGAALAGVLMRSPWLYRVVTRLLRRIGRSLPGGLRDGLAGSWSRARALPDLPKESFRERFAREEAARHAER